VEKIVNPEGEPMVFNHQDGKLFIDASQDAKLGESYHLVVYYQGKMPIAPNAPWQGGFSLAKSPNGNHWIGLSCQNDGADIFMPCKDQPYDKPDSVRMRITVPTGYQAIGNGLLEKIENEEGKEAYTWFTQYPINNYSINFTVGKFKDFKTSYTSVDNNEVAVHVYLLEEHTDQLETLAAMAIDNLQHHEQYFGEYPFAKEKFGLVHTPYLGMEHQTINAYGNDFRYTETQGKKYDWLLLHELGHEWWANKVTAADWADFWIHEGICSFSDALYLYTNFGWDEYWKKMVQTRNNIVNDKAIVLGREVNSVQAYHPGVYGKASFVLHMMWDMMGDDLFFGILYDLANNPESTYSNPVTTADFIAFVNSKSGANYENFLRFYLETTEMAEVQVAKGEDDSWSIWLSNTNFSLPLEVETSEGIERIDISPQPISIRSKNSPKVDPKGLYLRKINMR
jgi:aminopeptidase N